MDMTINNQAYEAFSKTAFKSADAIANLDGKGGVKESGKLGSIFSRLGRSDAERTNNNAVRTAFLKSLGQAFNLAGMNEADGKTTFTPEFVASLEKLLGRKVLKTADFKIAADGTVSSGKPLTQRRINEILTKAATIAKAQSFDCKHYETRLAEARKGLAKLNMNSGLNVSYAKQFDHVENCLKFLKNDFDNLLVENPKWVANGADFNPDNEFPRYILKQKEYVNEEGTKIPAKDVEIPTKGTLALWLGMNGPRGLFHTELYGNIPREIKTPEDKKALMDYIKNTIAAYVQGTIDLFLDAQAEGPEKVHELVDAWNGKSHACMDAKAAVSDELREKLGLMTDEQLAVKFASSHTSETKLDECIYDEINLAIQKRAAKKLPPAKGWQDLADMVKKGLVGEKRPVVTLDESGSLKPLTENGKPVVRQVTAEDVDKIGPACCQVLGIFD